MDRFAKATLVSALLLGLGGCATPPVAGGGAPAWPPLAPASLGGTRTAQQVLRVAFGEREATLNCVVSVTPQSLTVIGTTAAGVRAFTVKYDGANVQAQNHLPMSDSSLPPPERLLDDLQLVHWPLRALEQHFKGTQWEVVEPYPGTRRLRRSGKLVTEVHYAGTDAWNGRAWLVNVEVGYTLGIESKQMSDAR